MYGGWLIQDGETKASNLCICRTCVERFRIVLVGLLREFELFQVVLPVFLVFDNTAHSEWLCQWTWILNASCLKRLRQQPNVEQYRSLHIPTTSSILKWMSISRKFLTDLTPSRLNAVLFILTLHCSMFASTMQEPSSGRSLKVRRTV